MKPFKTIFVTSMLLFVTFSILWASNVINTDMSNPLEIVQTRKTIMQAIKLNMDDVKEKIKNKNLKSIQANAIAIDAMARVIPPLYKETYDSVYTGKGVYYKGAPASEIEAIALNLSNAVQTLKFEAADENKKKIDGGIGQVYQTCAACHNKYRGKF
jgi:cytochrome c556